MKATGSYTPWVALQVRPKMEKTAAQHLAYRGYEHFLPMRRAGGATVKPDMELPLFPGYVFCRFTTDASATMVSTPGVSRIVSFGGTPAWVAEEEIAGIRQAIDSGQPVVPMASFLPGASVLITEGPLQGVRGTVLGIDDTRYLIISITMLGRSVAVELQPSWVRRQWPTPDHLAYETDLFRPVRGTA